MSTVTATVSAGTVVRGNVGPDRRCLSGTLLKITFIGTFPNIVVAGAPGRAAGGAVHQVLIAADPFAGHPCLLSVGTGQRKPRPGATDLSSLALGHH